MVPPKSHVSSPLSNQLATIHSLFNSTQTQTLLQSHSQGTSGTTTSGSGGNSSSAVRSSISEMSARNNAIHGNKGNTNTSKWVDLREKKSKESVLALFSQSLWLFCLFVYRFSVTFGIWRLSGAGWLLGGGGNYSWWRCFVWQHQPEQTAVEKTTGFTSPQRETERWGSTMFSFLLAPHTYGWDGNDENVFHTTVTISISIYFYK